jgi:hypothetical protein
MPLEVAHVHKLCDEWRLRGFTFPSWLWTRYHKLSLRSKVIGSMMMRNYTYVFMGRHPPKLYDCHLEPPVNRVSSVLLTYTKIFDLLSCGCY